MHILVYIMYINHVLMIVAKKQQHGLHMHKAIDVQFGCLRKWKLLKCYQKIDFYQD